MKHAIKICILTLLLLPLSLSVSAQEYNKQDSAAACKNAADFFNWYLGGIRKRDFNAYQPKFVPSSNGMTTLDFSKYLANLAAHHLSDSLIQAEKKSYTTCILNLEKIRYTDFEKYTDLDQFQEINCDFGNSYTWLHSQEASDAAAVKSISFRNKETAVVTFALGMYYTNEGHATCSYYETRYMIMKKINNVWKIVNI